MNERDSLVPALWENTKVLFSRNADDGINHFHAFIFMLRKRAKLQLSKDCLFDNILIKLG